MMSSLWFTDRQTEGFIVLHIPEIYLISHPQSLWMKYSVWMTFTRFSSTLISEFPPSSKLCVSSLTSLLRTKKLLCLNVACISTVASSVPQTCLLVWCTFSSVSRTDKLCCSERPSPRSEAGNTNTECVQPWSSCPEVAECLENTTLWAGTFLPATLERNVDHSCCGGSWWKFLQRSPGPRRSRNDCNESWITCQTSPIDCRVRHRSCWPLPQGGVNVENIPWYVTLSGTLTFWFQMSSYIKVIFRNR